MTVLSLCATTSYVKGTVKGLTKLIDSAASNAMKEAMSAKFGGLGGAAKLNAFGAATKKGAASKINPFAKKS